MSGSEDADDDRETPATPRAAIDHIEAQATALRDEELTRALTRIEERGELTPKKRVVLAALADRLTSRLIDPPKAGLRAAADHDEDTTVAVALDLFSE